MSAVTLNAMGTALRAVRVCANRSIAQNSHGTHTAVRDCGQFVQVTINPLVTNRNPPSQAAAFVPGDSIKVTAAGATVPAFTAQVTFPGNVSLITPPLGGGQPLVVDTTQPLAVSWTQTSAPEVLFYVVQDTGTLPSPVLVCYFESRLARAVGVAQRR